MLLLSMLAQPKMEYVREKIGLTGQFDPSQPGNFYLQPYPIDVAMQKISRNISLI